MNQERKHGCRLAALPFSRLGLLFGLVLSGCAALTLNKAESEWMIQQYGAWESRINLYGPIAAGAYRDGPLPTGFTRFVIDVPGAIPRASTAYVFRTDEAARKHFIGIEGTQDVNELLLDARAVRREDSSLAIAVHPGFDEVARAVYQDLKKHDRLRPGYAVGVTGHSLGGAGVVLLAMYLERDNLRVNEVVTFGQPMVTDREGVVVFKTLLARTLRVVACDDVVPFLPPVGYAPGGLVLLLLDPPNFEFSNEEVARPVAVALLDDFRHQRESGKWFYGHRMPDYLKRLSTERTEPLRYAQREARYCRGRSE